MVPNTIELFIRDLPEGEAVDWLRDTFDAVTQIDETPVHAYEATHEEASVRIQMTEHVKNGPYTSLWIRASDLPWTTTVACAEAAHHALGREVLCHLDDPEDPWRMAQFVDGTEHTVDEREITF